MYTGQRLRRFNVPLSESLGFEISKSGMDFSVPSLFLARGRNCPSPVDVSLRFPHFKPNETPRATAAFAHRRACRPSLQKTEPSPAATASSLPFPPYPSAPDRNRQFTDTRQAVRHRAKKASNCATPSSTARPAFQAKLRDVAVYIPRYIHASLAGKSKSAASGFSSDCHHTRPSTPEILRRWISHNLCVNNRSIKSLLRHACCATSTLSLEWQHNKL